MGRDFINKGNKTEPIRQHLVPKLYLKRFAIDGKFVYVKQRKTGTIFKANIDKIVAPVKKGDKVGTIDIIEDNKIIGTVEATVKEDIAKALEELGVGASIRGETLTLEQFARLSNILKKYM